jgi:hypothetical protein
MQPLNPNLISILEPLPHFYFITNYAHCTWYNYIKRTNIEMVLVISFVGYGLYLDVKNEVVYVYIPTIKLVDTKDKRYLRLDKTHDLSY